jgi:hypothetical protein
LVSLHPENMNLDSTYQPDSIKELKPLDTIIAVPETEGLKFEPTVQNSLENIPVRERAASFDKNKFFLSVKEEHQTAGTNSDGGRIKIY